MLKKQMKKIYISPNGKSIILKSMCIKNSELEYRFEKLPSKLKAWYKYAVDFISIIKSKTPKIIYANRVLKC